MSVRNIGNAIKEARTKAGLSREKISEGICSPVSLSRIENGLSGVSPATFQALMARAGASCEIFPLFENRNDYECFFSLKHARFHLDAWQLDPAYEELNQVESRNWNNNKLYYQEWLMLHGILQFRSGMGEHKQMYDTFLAALYISKPDIHLQDFQHLLLSVNEIELLIYIAQELLYLHQKELCRIICTQIHSYLRKSQITFQEKDKLLAEYAIVYAKFLISEKEYSSAWSLVNGHRHQMVVNRCDAPLLELTFLTGLCEYYSGKKTDVAEHLKDTLYAANAIESPYAAICKKYIINHALMEMPKNLQDAPEIQMKYFPAKKVIDYSDFSDGVYDFYGTDIVTIGSLIRELRVKQKISQPVLCRGLCSKSKLSKIENGTLNPDVILAEILLQRLGISEREFVFWGNEKESNFHEIKCKLVSRMDYSLSEDQKKDLNELKQLITDKDILYRQYLLYEESYLIDDPEKRIVLLKEALSLTLKDFDIYKIMEYRLSWTELTILNSIAFEYRFTAAPYQGIPYFRQILAYHRAVQPDCILQSQTLAVTFHLFFRLLYSQNYHKELIDQFTETDLSITKYSMLRHGMIFFYYSQSLGECKQYQNVSLPACYSCGINNLLKIPENVTALKNALWNDFSIDINY